jgi:hypothetical protein
VLEGNSYLKNLDVDGRIILKLILEEGEDVDFIQVTWAGYSDGPLEIQE